MKIYAPSASRKTALQKNVLQKNVLQKSLLQKDALQKSAAVLLGLALGAGVLFTGKAISPPAAPAQFHAELPPATTLEAAFYSAAELPPVSPAPRETVIETAMPLAAQSAPIAHAPVLWQLAGAKSALPSIALSAHIVAYAMVELPPQSGIFPAVGEQVSLPILAGDSVLAKVESVRYLQNGDYSWSGHLEGYGSDYPVVMTYGERAVFATITTPQGSYTLESSDGLGWLYKNPAEIELSAHGSKDFLEVEIAPQE